MAILQHFSRRVRWKIVLQGILIEIRRNRHITGMLVLVGLVCYEREGERERERERESERDYFFLSARRKALAPAVCYAQCVASTRRSKFNVCRGVRFGQLPQAASSSGLPESRARAISPISREREFSLWRRVVRSSFTVRSPSPVRVVPFIIRVIRYTSKRHDSL